MSLFVFVSLGRCFLAASASLSQAAAGRMAYDQNGLGELARSLGGHGWGGNAITAAANSPLPQIEIGLSEYRALGAPPDKIVLALPW